MESIEFILKVNFPLIVVHFSQLIELRIDVLMDVFYQLAVHHRLVDKLVIKFLLWKLLLLWEIVDFPNGYFISIIQVLFKNSGNH